MGAEVVVVGQRENCVGVQQKGERQQKETPPFVSQWSPTCVLEKALSCLTSLIGREAVYPGWYERFWKREPQTLHYILLAFWKHTEHAVVSVVFNAPLA